MNDHVLVYIHLPDEKDAFEWRTEVGCHIPQEGETISYHEWRLPEDTEGFFQRNLNEYGPFRVVKREFSFQYQEVNRGRDVYYQVVDLYCTEKE